MYGSGLEIVPEPYFHHYNNRHMRKAIFYYVIAGIVILNSLLLSNPNLLGKIGIIIYKHYYLRNFPRTLLTVSLVVGVAIGLAESIQYLVHKTYLNRKLGVLILSVLLAVGFVILLKTGIAFNKWTYSHTGLRFQLGAMLLPILVVFIFIHALVKLSRAKPAFPLSPISEDKNSQQNTQSNDH